MSSHRSSSGDGAVSAASARLIAHGLRDIESIARVAREELPLQCADDSLALVGGLLQALERVHLVAFSLARLVPAGGAAEPDAPVDAARATVTAASDSDADALGADALPPGASTDTGLAPGESRRALLFSGSVDRPDIDDGDAGASAIDSSLLAALALAGRSTGEGDARTLAGAVARAETEALMRTQLSSWTTRIASTAEQIRRLQQRISDGSDKSP
jgi:hypothetical protein